MTPFISQPHTQTDKWHQRPLWPVNNAQRSIVVKGQGLDEWLRARKSEVEWTLAIDLLLSLSSHGCQKKRAHVSLIFNCDRDVIIVPYRGGGSRQCTLSTKGRWRLRNWVGEERHGQGNGGPEAGAPEATWLHYHYFRWDGVRMPEWLNSGWLIWTFFGSVRSPNGGCCTSQYIISSRHVMNTRSFVRLKPQYNKWTLKNCNRHRELSWFM